MNFTFTTIFKVGMHYGGLLNMDFNKASLASKESINPRRLSAGSNGSLPEYVHIDVQTFSSMTSAQLPIFDAVVLCKGFNLQ